MWVMFVTCQIHVWPTLTSWASKLVIDEAGIPIIIIPPEPSGTIFACAKEVVLPSASGMVWPKVAARVPTAAPASGLVKGSRIAGGT